MSPVLITAAETSKVPFFILGGSLALWAVVLAGIGMRNPDFPYNLRGQRGVIGAHAGDRRAGDRRRDPHG